MQILRGRKITLTVKEHVLTYTRTNVAVFPAYVTSIAVVVEMYSGLDFGSGSRCSSSSPSASPCGRLPLVLGQAYKHDLTTEPRKLHAAQNPPPGGCEDG